MSTTVMKHHSTSDNMQELRVTFNPELFLQRRVWILNFLRKEGITRVLDVGCGEGALLDALCQPAPWLQPPPSNILPASPDSSLSCPNSPAVHASIGSSPQNATKILPSPAYSYTDDDIPNLHIKELHGLDIADEDLAFAVEAIAPPKPVEDLYSMYGSPPSRIRSYSRGLQRWEELESKVWKGGLEVPNEQFVDMECIVAMEVIEHLHPDVLAKFAPTLLGLYHPDFLLITTPSYTFNDRFLPLDAPLSARSGYPDPTGRTDRVFRHSDHKFEWTREEFQAWCKDVAEEWGYDVNETSIGRASEHDPWGRDDELQGATQVAAFYRNNSRMRNDDRSSKAKEFLSSLPSSSAPPHCLLSASSHQANAASRRPAPFSDIARLVKSRMEEIRYSFLRVEELWFEPEIGELCGGWIEVLVRAIEESDELAIKRDEDDAQKGRRMWTIELLGGVHSPAVGWGNGKTLVEDEEGEEAEEWRKRMSGEYDLFPEDWVPGETSYERSSSTAVEDQSDMDGTTGAEEGDISAVSDNDEDEDLTHRPKRKSRWGSWSTPNEKGVDNLSKVDGKKPSNGWYGQSGGDWANGGGWDNGSGWGEFGHIPHSAISSTGGWDGDESDADTAA